jgi:putative nucleotidyltransferase with HDIG domain
MGNREALQLLGNRINLPTLPDVVARISRMMDDPRVGLHEIGHVIAEDPGLTARVLRIANSAFYGLSEPVLSAEQAAAVVGARSLRNIAMQASLMQRFEHLSGVPDFDLQDVWSHAMLTARLSEAISRLARVASDLEPEDYYTCGLLHDVGKVILLEGLGEDYVEILRHARTSQHALHLSEEAALGFTHVHVGSLLAARWKLPEPIATAIQFHHGPMAEVIVRPSVAVVAIADQVAYRVASDGDQPAMGNLAALARKVLGITPEGFEQVIALARAQDAGIAS